MNRAAILAFGVCIAASAFAQAPDQSLAPSVPGAAQALLAPGAGPADASSAADLAAGLPSVPTEIVMRPSHAAPGKLSAGDLVVLTIRPAPDQGDGAKPPESAKLETEPLEWGDGRILWWKPFDPKSGTITVGMTTYKPGKFQIKRIPFSKDGKPLFASEAKEVEFASVGGDKAKDDIYEPTSLSLPLWVLILMALASLALAFGLIWWINEWYRKRKAKIAELANAPKVLTPPEEFEKVRRDSDQRGELDKGTFKPYYFALSEAAKRFLGKSYRFDAEERTTRELLVELERLGMSVELLDQWERIFDEMDIIKFTDQTPEGEVAKSLGGRLSQAVGLSYTKSPFYRELMAQQQALQQKASQKTSQGEAK